MELLEDDCEAGDYYKQILAARFQLYHIVSTDNWLQAAEQSLKKKEVMNERGTLAMEALDELHSDLKEFGDAILVRGPEALWRWEFGQGTNCSKPILGPNTRIWAASSPTQCFLPQYQTEGWDVKTGPCSAWPDPFTEYDGRAIFEDPVTHVVTTNPGGHFPDIPTLCIRYLPLLTNMIWQNCTDIPDDEKFKAEWVTRAGMPPDYQLNIKNDKYGCLGMKRFLDDGSALAAVTKDCDFDLDYETFFFLGDTNM